MAIVDIPAMPVVSSRKFASGVGTFTTVVMNSTANGKCGAAFVLRPGESVSYVTLLPTARTNSVNLRVSLQPFNSGTSTPSGTPVQNGIGIDASAIVDSSTFTLNAINEVILDDVYTNETSEIQTLACVIEYAGTGQNFDGTHTLTIATAMTPIGSTAYGGMGYNLIYSSSAWSKGGAVPMICPSFNGPIPGCMAIEAQANQVWGSGDSNPSRGNCYIPTTKVRICGVLTHWVPAAGQTWDYRVYVNGTLAASVSCDKTQEVSSASTTLIHYMDLPVKVTANAGDLVYVVIAATNATQCTTCNRYSFRNAADLRQSLEYFGATDVLSEVVGNNGSPFNWTRTTTRYMPIVPVIDGIETPATPTGGPLAYIANLNGNLSQ